MYTWGIIHLCLCIYDVGNQSLLNNKWKIIDPYHACNLFFANWSVQWDFFCNLQNYATLSVCHVIQLPAQRWPSCSPLNRVQARFCFLALVLYFESDLSLLDVVYLSFVFSFICFLLGLLWLEDSNHRAQFLSSIVVYLMGKDLIEFQKVKKFCRDVGYQFSVRRTEL